MKRHLVIILIIVLGSNLLFNNKKANKQPQILRSEENSLSQQDEVTELDSDEPRIRKLGETEQVATQSEKTSEYVYEERRITLTGKIETADRISENIPYDYIIVTDTKVTGWDATGIPGGVNKLVIVSEPTEDGRVTPEIIKQIKSMEGKRVELTAIIEWGYAEHAQLLVQEINEL